jgi:hypothetical protein
MRTILFCQLSLAVMRRIEGYSDRRYDYCTNDKFPAEAA